MVLKTGKVHLCIPVYTTVFDTPFFAYSLVFALSYHYLVVPQVWVKVTYYLHVFRLKIQYTQSNIITRSPIIGYFIGHTSL